MLAKIAQLISASWCVGVAVLTRQVAVGSACLKLRTVCLWLEDSAGRNAAENKGRHHRTRYIILVSGIIKKKYADFEVTFRCRASAYVKLRTAYQGYSVQQYLLSYLAGAEREAAGG